MKVRTVKWLAVLVALAAIALEWRRKRSRHAGT